MKLDDAIALSVMKHQGQVDRAGKPYILHPLRVMLRMDSEIEMMAAVLHDVVEDSDVTLERLTDMGCPAYVVCAVDHLSKREGEDYPDFVERAACDLIARKVKLADLEDNLDVRRKLEFTDKDISRVRRYLNARTYLMSLE